MSDPISKELEALYRADRARALEQPPEAARRALEAHLAPLLGGSPPTPPASGGGSGPDGGPAPVSPGGGSLRSLAAKAAAVFATGAVVGSITTLALRPPRVEVRTVEVERRVEVPIVVPSSPPPSPVPAPLPSSSSSSLAIARPPQPERTSDPAEGDRMLARERVLLEGARSALARRDANAALAVTERHAHEFPKGRLTEEREALAIQALVLAGRQDEARSRATRFRSRFPGGFFLPVVEAAVGSPETTK